MASKTYVVEEQLDKMGREKVVYAGQDADEACRVLENSGVPREQKHGPLHAFIHVWEGGEHQFCTRDPDMVE